MASDIPGVNPFSHFESWVGSFIAKFITLILIAPISHRYSFFLFLNSTTQSTKNVWKGKFDVILSRCELFEEWRDDKGQ